MKRRKMARSDRTIQSNEKREREEGGGDEERSKASVQRQCATSNHWLSRFPPPAPDLLPLLPGTVPPPILPSHPSSRRSSLNDNVFHWHTRTSRNVRTRAEWVRGNGERRAGGDQATARKGAGGRARGSARGLSTSSALDGHACVFARTAAHLSVSPGICTHAEARMCACAHSEELVWHPAVERWQTWGGDGRWDDRRARDEGEARRIMRVST